MKALFHPLTLLLGALLICTSAFAQITRVQSSNDANLLTIKLDFNGAWYWHRVYLDTDENAASGFRSATVSVGAEFLVEGHWLYRYTGNGNSWSWQPLSTIATIYSSGDIEWLIPRADIGESATPGGTRFHVNVQSQNGLNSNSGPHVHRYSAPPSPTRQSLAMPAYVWSGDRSTWDRVLATDPQQIDTLVINPNNGTATSVQAALVSHVQRARAQNRRVLGYVFTQRGARNINNVLADIDRYYRFYAVNGIFLDEGSVNCTSVSYYARIRDHIRAKGGDQQIVQNPGGVFPECLMPTADVFMSFETDANTYLNTPNAWVLPPFAANYPRSRFWHVVYGARQDQIAAIVGKSKQLHVGRIWLTPDTTPNPYDTLPLANYLADVWRLAQ